MPNDLIVEGGDIPAFLNYRPTGAPTPFPGTICISVNNEIVHGIPKKSKVLKEGDIVSLDLGLQHDGFFTDHAVTLYLLAKFQRKMRNYLKQPKKP